jgi:hypothetical protein
MTASPDGRRLAMWSGPRNISTALMRSWGNRPDTIVCDEPLYAHYLLATGAAHPGADEVVRCHDPDWRRVAETLTRPLEAPRTIFYQKHMAHHLLPHIERDWMDRLDHGFLIRDPLAMLPSLAKFLARPTLADTGLPQQVELFEWFSRRIGRLAPVVDAADVLADPRRILTQLCAAWEVEFREEMLWWPPGRRETDGVWAVHWYAEVEKSNGFGPPRSAGGTLPPALAGLYEECLPLYRRLHAARLA